MKPTKLAAGDVFPSVPAPSRVGDVVDLSTIKGKERWTMLVVYRVLHCPLCTRYLNEMEGFVERLDSLGVDLVAVSGDSREQLESHLEKLNVTYPLHYGLTVEQMEELGLYISHPRSPSETDHPFAEPGLFVINENGQLQVVDLSNNPFVRPALETLVSGLEWIRNPDNNYPIRGTWPAKPS